MKRKTVNVNWTEATFSYKGHAAIREFMVESTDNLNEVQDFNQSKLSAKENRISNVKRKFSVVNITEEAFELQYYRVFGCTDKAKKEEVIVQPTEAIKAEIEVQTTTTVDELDPWTTRFRM